MYKLGITGGMGSGKSTATSYFKSKGAKIFDADEKAKQLLINSESIQGKIIHEFGEIITSNNIIDLKKLSKYAFASKINQQILNDIIWPEVAKLILSASELAKKKNTPLFIVDAALLLEAKYSHFFDSILLITADKTIRQQRASLRKNIPIDQIEKRMALQLPEDEKAKISDFIIKNNGDIAEFYRELEEFFITLP